MSVVPSSIFKKYIAPNLERGEKKEILKLMRTKQRDLDKDKKVQEYLSKHRVYLTMTTSPVRLRKATTVLAMALQNKYIEKAYIALPELYRNTDKYKESDLRFVQSLDPRIVFIRVKKDMGPVTKMLPTVMRRRDKDAIVISLDDDIGYPASLINELIYYSVHQPNVIHTGACFSFGDYPSSKINRHLWPDYYKPRGYYGDIVEGWGGIAYKKKFIDKKIIDKLNKSGTICKLSDDLTISYSLAIRGIKRKEIDSKYYDRDMLYPLGYGEMDDALHHGSGTDIKDEEDANMLKYKQCLENLVNKGIITKGVGKHGSKMN